MDACAALLLDAAADGPASPRGRPALRSLLDDPGAPGGCVAAPPHRPDAGRPAPCCVPRDSRAPPRPPGPPQAHGAPPGRALRTRGRMRHAARAGRGRGRARRRRRLSAPPRALVAADCVRSSARGCGRGGGGGGGCGRGRHAAGALQWVCCCCSAWRGVRGNVCSERGFGTCVHGHRHKSREGSSAPTVSLRRWRRKALSRPGAEVLPRRATWTQFSL